MFVFWVLNNWFMRLKLFRSWSRDWKFELISRDFNKFHSATPEAYKLIDNFMLKEIPERLFILYSFLLFFK